MPDLPFFFGRKFPLRSSARSLTLFSLFNWRRAIGASISYSGSTIVVEPFAHLLHVRIGPIL
jgi:hypothetical protein